MWRRSPSQTLCPAPEARARTRYLLITAGFWASLAVAGVALAWLLPRLWLNGGILELRIPAALIEPRSGFTYAFPFNRMIKHDFPRSGGERGTEAVSLFFRIASDADGMPQATLELYEDGRLLGPAHASPREMRREGLGRFTYRDFWLFFSTSDNSNPRTNGRSYVVKKISQPRVEPLPLAMVAVIWLAAVSLLLAAAFRWRPTVRFIEDSNADRSPALVVFFLVSVCTFYAFFFAGWHRLGIRYLIFIGLVSALFLLAFRRPLVLRRWMIWPAAFVACAAGCPVLDPSSLVSWTTIQSMSLSALVGWIVFSAMWQGLARERGLPGLFVMVLCLFYALVMLVQNFGFNLKSFVASLHGLETLPWQFGTWNQKYQESWLILLSWIVVSAIVRQGRKTWMLVVIVVLTSGLAISSGHAYSTKMCFLVGLAVFVGALYRPRTLRILVALAALALLLFMPLLAGQLWGFLVEHPSIVDEKDGVGNHLARRLVVWEYSRELIGQRPWFGWGLGASGQLPGSGGTAEEVMTDGTELPAVLAKLRVFPGSHPHSLPLLIWLETGAIGAVLVTGLILKLFGSLGRVEDRVRHAGLLALMASFFIIFAFNYSAWHPMFQILFVGTAGLVGSLHGTRSEREPEDVGSDGPRTALPESRDRESDL